MLSKDHRLRVTIIASKIRLDRHVSLDDMIWYNKIVEDNEHARSISKRIGG